MLDGLHKATSHACGLSVLGALLFPVRWGDWDSIEVGKTLFLHKSLPKGWADEHIELSRQLPAPGFMIAQLALAPFTMSETMQMVEPLGVDRWSFELAHKYGMRDRLTCPVGRRWVVVYWSRKVLSNQLSPQLRALLFMAANFAAIRLEQIVGPDSQRIGNFTQLTPRELSVLRLASNGIRTRKIAELLELGEETVRSHIKKAQSKLGARDRLHAVAEALRLQLIP